MFLFRASQAPTLNEGGGEGRLCVVKCRQCMYGMCIYSTIHRIYTATYTASYTMMYIMFVCLSVCIHTKSIFLLHRYSFVIFPHLGCIGDIQPRVHTLHTPFFLMLYELLIDCFFRINTISLHQLDTFTLFHQH